jgi:hypothetical protein
VTAFHVAGVDLSMVRTGLAVMRFDEGGQGGRILLEAVASKPGPKGEASDDSYPPMLDRLRGIATRIIRLVRTGRQPEDVCIVVLEGPSLGSGTRGKQQHQHTRAGLWWLMYHLLSKEATVVIVPPKTLKSYVAKNGNADKVLMMERAKDSAFPGINFRGDDNLVDAYGLAAMAARELGYPVEPSAQRVNPGALDAVRWPHFMEQNRRTT